VKNNTKDELGKAIKSARLERGMTRAELAKKMHITPRHIGAIENGSKKPSFELLFHLVHELHCHCLCVFRQFEWQLFHDRECSVLNIDILQACSRATLKVARMYRTELLERPFANRSRYILSIVSAVSALSLNRPICGMMWFSILRLYPSAVDGRRLDVQYVSYQFVRYSASVCLPFEESTGA
jgi:transcriptional regulator with XRE-family HTH domain